MNFIIGTCNFWIISKEVKSMEVAFWCCICFCFCSDFAFVLAFFCFCSSFLLFLLLLLFFVYFLLLSFAFFCFLLLSFDFDYVFAFVLVFFFLCSCFLLFLFLLLFFGFCFAFFCFLLLSFAFFWFWLCFIYPYIYLYYAYLVASLCRQPHIWICMQVLVCARLDLVYRQGDIAQNVYFVKEGHLRFVHLVSFFLFFPFPFFSPLLRCRSSSQVSADKYIMLHWTLFFSRKATYGSCILFLSFFSFLSPSFLRCFAADRLPKWAQTSISCCIGRCFFGKWAQTSISCCIGRCFCCCCCCCFCGTDAIRPVDPPGMLSEALPAGQGESVLDVRS